MCHGTDCPKKESCYRYTAKPEPYQTYFVHTPLEIDGSCEYFWENTDYSRKGKEKSKSTHSVTTQ